MSHPTVNRRDFLASGLTLAGGLSLLGAAACESDRIAAPGTATTAGPAPAVGADGDLLNPPEIRSSGGLLTAAITCGTSATLVDGRQTLQPCTYGASFPAPTLRVRPGDLMDFTFSNKIVFDQADTKPGYGRPPRATNQTNLHFHGMHVSPIGDADNMLVMVGPNQSHRYLVQIPANHPAGLFWYHAHVHGLVTNHVSRGAAGMIYVANDYTDRLAQLGIRHRLMCLQQAYYAPDLRTLIFDDGNRDDPNLALSLINGSLMPTIRMRPGEPQVWSLLNASSSAFYLLRLQGHTFDVVADDGVPLVTPRRSRDTILIPSGKRLEVVVRASTTAGSYSLSYDSYFQGVDTWPQKSIGTVVVSGVPWSGPTHPGLDASGAPEDLSGLKVKKDFQRTITLAVDPNVPEGTFGRFTINGHPWDPSYSEWTSTLGAVEEWTFVNTTEQEHPMHVHTNPFQVVAVNGAPVPFEGTQDTAIVPRFGTLTVRTRFRDFAGDPILMHCHILDHEDMGMMTSFTIEEARA